VLLRFPRVRRIHDQPRLVSADRKFLPILINKYSITHIYIFICSALSVFLRTNLISSGEHSTAPASAAAPAEAHAGQCRCGVRIQAVGADALAEARAGASHYSTEELAIVYSHLNAAYALLNDNNVSL
jgi:hypothetical protein